MDHRWLLEVSAFLAGLLLGSFVNVVIVRLPRGESIVSPPSRCPRCKARIRPWDNIPVVSYLLLRGRCRDCGKRIPWRYPVVELTAGLLLWLLSQLLIGPLMGSGPFSAYAGGLPAALDSLLRHLTYGALLGALTGRPPRSHSAWMHPAELEAHWRRARWLQSGATTHWRVR